MRYSVQFQSTTEVWVIFDTVAFYMLAARFGTEIEANREALRMAEADRKRVLGSKTPDYRCGKGIAPEYPESYRTLFC